MCGMHADGSKATGFKSMVVAQFTGIGLQKDDNAFVKYNSTTGVYEDNTVSGNEILSTNSRAVYKPIIKTSILSVLTTPLFKQFLSLLLVSLSTLYLKVVVTNLSLTLTPTSVQKH